MGGGGMGGGGGGMGGRRRDGWRRNGRRRWWAWRMGGGGGGAGARLEAWSIINRVTVPGPRQVLLHVKIAEINRTATRSIGVSWLYARGKSILGSAAGNNATMDFAANSAVAQTTGTKRICVCRAQQTVGATNAATPTGNCPALRRLRRGPLLAVHRRASHQRAGQDPGRAQPGRARRTARPVPGRRAVPVPGAAKLVDSGRNGRGDRPVSAVRHDPHVPARDPAQRRDPPRRRAGHQPAQLRPGDDGRHRQRPVDRPSEAPGPSSSCARDRRWRSPGCSRRSRTPPRPGFPAWATCRSSGPGSAPTRSRRSRPRRSCS